MTTARARGLGVEIRRLRKDAGLRLEELAEMCGWSRATFGRIETGEKVPTGIEIAIILGALGIRGGERKRLLELAHDAHQKHWWAVSRPGLPSHLISLLEFEQRATKITDISPGFVPGLLQTADYTRAVMRNGGLDEEVVESRASLRMGRQRLLTRAKPVALHALLDESILWRPVGGQRVMAGQLRHIARMSRYDHITVQVVPFSAGVHWALYGSVLIQEFARQRPIVYLEQRRSGLFLDEPEEIYPFLETATSVGEAALCPADSADLILARAEAMEVDG
ncbi:helix-turn-helix domain-containing protein [Saccharopolyspora flava]|uniref:helix-turn-helix domain-containing protein n=1 Tax=Saccharopolyspora flava TaxID=95161 RepID=UPI000B87A6C6|nr:helix-turn-helix transcriptional regulator [Saccharopolyspora flava]